MLKILLEKIKEREEKDYLEMVRKGEEYIKRKDITWKDVPFSQYIFMWSVSGLVVSLLYFYFSL